MKCIHKRLYSGIPVGIAIRGSIDDDRTFRVRPGNGHYNAILGEVYQDQYAYFVPGSINNAASQPYRRQWIAAVQKWQYDLTDEQKEAYNVKADKIRFLSGYNLFMRLAMKGEIDMFVDRGDAAGYDFEKTDLTADGNWHDLDLSSLVPAGAKAVLLRILINDDVSTSLLCMRKNGQANTYNQDMRLVKHANVLRHCTFIVGCDADRIVEYNASNTVWTTINIVVRGWWT